MKICINAGHTKISKGTGAVGLLNESLETRKITCELMKLLADTKHEVVPAIIDKSSNYLKDVVEIANNCDLLVSIHLNAGGGNGVEVLTWKGNKLPYATKVCENINKLGFKNRGVKDGSKLYVIKNTKCKAMLIECCFVDSETDKKLYNAEKIAKAIYEAIK